MIVLDTNVVSELMRARPDLSVLRWLKSYAESDIFISALTVTELRFGAALLPDGPDKSILNDRIDGILLTLFRTRVLSFDSRAAEICAYLMATKRARTPFVKIVDLQIAATALANGFAVATRDVDDFRHDGLRVINPWTD
jgi:toxin FitB